MQQLRSVSECIIAGSPTRPTSRMQGSGRVHQTRSLPAGVAMTSRTRDEERTAVRMVNERTLAPMLAPFLDQVSHLVPMGTYVAPADETAVRAPAGGQSSPVAWRAQVCAFRSFLALPAVRDMEYVYAAKLLLGDQSRQNVARFAAPGGSAGSPGGCVLTSYMGVAQPGCLRRHTNDTTPDPLHVL